VSPGIAGSAVANEPKGDVTPRVPRKPARSRYGARGRICLLCDVGLGEDADEPAQFDGPQTVIKPQSGRLFSKSAVSGAQDDRPLPRPHRLDRRVRKRTAPREQSAPANHDLVGVIGVPLVADVVEPTELRSVASHDPIAGGGRKQTTEFRLSPQTLLGILIPDPFAHRREA